MPHVTVKLIYTPKPEGDVVRAGDTWISLSRDRKWVESVENLSSSPAEAISVARATALVAGCADDRWRGWHWEAREADGHLLGETPLGEWYVNRDDCLKAIRTMFGYGVRVVLDLGDGNGELFRNEIDRYINPATDGDQTGANYCPDSSLLNYAAAHLDADDTPEADQ